MLSRQIYSGNDLEHNLLKITFVNTIFCLQKKSKIANNKILTLVICFNVYFCNPISYCITTVGTPAGFNPPFFTSVKP